jgi:hypothetical protein
MGPVPTGTEGIQPNRLEVETGVSRGAQRIVVYGTGGIGKTELCSLLTQVQIVPLFVDVEESSKFLDVDRIIPRTFEDVRAVLHDRGLTGRYDAVVVDSFTTLQDFAVTWTLANVKHEKGQFVKSVEGYGFGKGYTHVYETFLQILGDLDALVRAGKHVIGVCHDCVVTVPNPGGEDWLRYEHRLQQPKNTGQLRSRVQEWCDHLLFIGYDTAVNEDGKAQGTGTRSIYPTQLPTHLAKSRTLANRVKYDKGNPEIWKLLFGKE